MSVEQRATRHIAALALAEEGFRVLPCHTPTDGGCSCGEAGCESCGKHPRTARGCKDATSDPGQIDVWWTRWPDANIGVATGEELHVIDIDGHEAQASFDALCREHGPLPPTRVQRTGRDGGRQLWYRPPGQTALRGRRLLSNVDTRGEGGYVIAAPSLHKSGRTYEWEIPDAPLEELPAWVVEKLSTPRSAGANGNAAELPEQHPSTATDPTWLRRVEGLGRLALPDELEKLAAHSTDPATGRGTALYAAAARLGRIVGGDGLDLQATWTALEESGRRLGLGDDEVERSVERGLQEGMSDPLTPGALPDRPLPAPEQRPAATNGSGPVHAAGAAGEGRPLEDSAGWPTLSTSSLPAFPLDALPGDITRWVEAVAEETQTPPDLAAVAALGVLAAAALGAAIVDCGAWKEELVLYQLAVMPSGERKSPVLREALAPLRAIESERRKESAAGVRQRRLRKETLEARERKLVAKAGEQLGEEEAFEEELERIGAELEKIGEPHQPRLLADDATPEALAGLLARHKRIAVLAAEAPLVDNLIGRYDSSKSANLHLVCAAYSGEPTRIDRRRGDPEELDRPLMAITLTVQPHVLSNLIEHPIARAQGLVARFAYSLPESRMGARRIDVLPASREPHQAWEAIVRRITSLNPLTELTEPSSVSSVSTSVVEVLVLSLSPKSSQLLRELRAELEPRLKVEGDLRPVADWIAKHPGRVARIAGLLHLAAHEAATPIGEDTMRGALRIGEYFLAHSVAALTTPDELTRRALRWLAAREEPTVTQRDLHRGPLNSRGSAGEAQELVAALIEACALRPHAAPESDARGGRPPSPVYKINPHLK
ncbi:MAG: hypothetical protein DLM64_04865 [Solirubrobacterales bacterium]|nr:MAG: hypothetical protein DLM64_04865 [Solirubrobacterales bacterium]